MYHPYLLSLESSGDRSLCGGKASGLAALLRHGFSVPPGICVTTCAYVDTLHAARPNVAEMWARVNHASALDRERMLDEHRRHITALTIAPEILERLASALDNIGQAFASDREVLWAVRSSATNEDDTERTFAGLYRTVLGVQHGAVPAAITACWASLWTSRVWAYHTRGHSPEEAPAMAVIIQPLLSPRAAGVAYSRHSVTGQSGCVVINAVLGLAEPMVGGMVTPDCYVLDMDGEPANVLERSIATKLRARRPTAGGVHEVTVPSAEQQRPSLTDEEALALACLVQQVERAMNHPVDMEWALDERGLWLLQARSILNPAAKPDPGGLTDAACAWSRANFKETLPDLPSPMGLSLLRQFIETHIVRPYLQLGCVTPAGLSSIRILHGRPYINVTLFQSFMAQLGGDPALVAEHMGGEAPVPPVVKRLPWWRLLGAGVIMEWKIRQAARQAPRWFAEMKCLADSQKGRAIASLPPAELLSRFDQFGARLSSCDLTFAIVAGVSQAFYALQRLLERRVGKDWRPLLNAALQGSGTVISARQIQWLRKCADIAGEESIAVEFFHSAPWKPEQYRTALAGTRFLHAFDDYLTEYGHRAVGESDVMSPRFFEAPDSVLDVVRGYMIAPPPLSRLDVPGRQFNARQRALQRLRTAFGWRYHEWIGVYWWHTRLSRFLTLREANRHHLMYVTSAVRQLLLTIGGRFVSGGVLNRQDDIFFLSHEELGALVSGNIRDCKSVVASRRAERARNVAQPAPDFVMDHGPAVQQTDAADASSGQALQALSISSGVVSGPVRLVRSQEDFQTVQRGDIVVTAVIDPGMAPLFGLAGGLIAEMGGILSHGAIIAREYGLPAVANIHGITRLVRDGQHIILNADTGQVTISNGGSMDPIAPSGHRT